MAMALGLCEFRSLKIVVNKPIRLFCDDQSAISIAHNHVQHDRIKHIEIDRHFIKEKLEKGIIQIPYVPSEKQVADLLTKGLATRIFENLICKIGMIDIHSPVRGGVLPCEIQEKEESSLPRLLLEC